jgi:hypothetical protein
VILKVFAHEPQHTALMIVISNAIENVTGTYTIFPTGAARRAADQIACCPALLSRQRELQYQTQREGN